MRVSMYFSYLGYHFLKASLNFRSSFYPINIGLFLSASIYTPVMWESLTRILCIAKKGWRGTFGVFILCCGMHFRLDFNFCVDFERCNKCKTSTKETRDRFWNHVLSRYFFYTAKFTTVCILNTVCYSFGKIRTHYLCIVVSEIGQF